MNIRQALAAARAAGVDRLDAQLMLGALTGRDRAALLAHDEAELDAVQALRLGRWIARRAAGEPLAYVTGRSEFRGLMLDVSPATLIPRPETELLVEWGLECLTAAAAPAVVDLGTGSGAIALAIKCALPAATVTACDCSADALAVARGNGLRLGIEVEWLEGDWWTPLAGRRYALALANPPYVAGDDPHLAALGHEPRGALTPEGDGLAALRRIVDGAPAHLLPGAWLLLEHGHDQADAVGRMLAARGFGPPRTRHDLAGLARCTGAAWCG
ncbi:MAG: peptide chain release factor N(5)-glutamine methyltransferase [Burkholderiales bacterium]|nr:peptide chain release factor N(5)-glutamine methyltransferase [Burkholderiales bacterium]